MFSQTKLYFGVHIVVAAVGINAVSQTDLFAQGFLQRPKKNMFGLDRCRNLLQTISTGHFGSASRKDWPYCFVKTRLSKTTMMPGSGLVRIRRPTPWRNFRMASGSENSPKALPPRASIA